ncbi:hypothetical protein [Bifidobacterium magnum]|uniref:Putative excisionase family DNA binding protein n=1 Tax=Bifidobacterium magnum TaxID=1692 RepID=A0A087B9N5_9BIFI|nr:hypothetical protein [Bifidobacterium magnum]KFI67735.1 putative excisionase family DNA binding protein [Bifidobacterium magnum]
MSMTTLQPYKERLHRNQFFRQNAVYPRLITVDEAVEISGMSSSTIREEMRRNAFPSIKDHHRKMWIEYPTFCTWLRFKKGNMQ